MDNIIIKKIYQDGDLIELLVEAKSEYVKVKQTCYISLDDLIKNGNIIKKYDHNTKTDTYVEFGNKKGNFTPAFSMKILPCDNYGHVLIELDMEIADNKTRIHRCTFYINTELGLLITFGEKLKEINKMELNKSIFLYDEY